MSFWTAMVVMVAIIAFTSLRIARYRAGLGHPPRRQSIHGAGADAISARESELRKEVEELRERIKVLERIATDDRHSRAIANEIEELRDR